MQKNRKLFFLIFFLLFFSFVFAAADTEIQYPTVPGAPAPTATTTFPAYVKYLFNFAIIIAGLIVLAVLTWAGILYLTSSGDPTKAQEAKSKATGAFLGLLILLCSYLILTTINPQLTGVTLQPISPVSGIYLINPSNPEQKFYLANSSPKIPPQYQNFTDIKFISTPTELIEIYVYQDEEFKGNNAKIQNTGLGLSPFPIKSIYFLWNRPGVYLYQDTNFNIGDFGRALYLLAGEINDLSPLDFNDKASSLKFVKGGGSGYGTVLFTEPIFRGKCGYISSHCGNMAFDFPDLSTSSISTAYCSVQGGDMYEHPIGTSTLSSLKTFITATATTTYGIIDFYDRINCQGNSRRFVVDNSKTTIQGDNLTPTGSCKLDEYSCAEYWAMVPPQNPNCDCYFDTTKIPLDGNIKSFRLNRIGSDLKVIISSGPELSGDRCEVLPETYDGKADTCYTLKNGYSYNTDPDDLIHKVHSFLIFPVEKF